MKRLVVTTLLVFLLGLLVPLNISAAIMEDFMEKRDSIRFRGEILEHKVRSFDVEEQLSRYPNVIDVEMPDNFQIEPFSLDDFNTSHVPSLGSFKGYTEEQFNKSKQDILSTFNNKRNNLLAQYNGESKKINQKINQAHHDYQFSKNDLKKDFDKSAKQLSQLFEQKSKNLGKELDKKEQQIKNQLQKNYEAKKKEIDSIIEKNKVDFWGEESDRNLANAKNNYNRISDKVNAEIKEMNRMAVEFEKIWNKQQERMKQHRIRFDNYDHEVESKALFDKVRLEKPDNLESIINDIKNKVDEKHANFKHYNLE